MLEKKRMFAMTVLAICRRLKIKCSDFDEGIKSILSRRKI